MNLLQVRTKFREISGRFDLVNEDYSDNGADFYINEGRKFLDRLNTHQKSFASCFRFVEINAFSASFPHCRAIKEVWCMSTTARWQLEKKDMNELISDYLSGDPAGRSSGEPDYYTPVLTRYIPADATPTDIESYLQWVDIPTGNSEEYNTILLSSPVDKKVSLEIKGLFYSMELVNDTDTNYWSTIHPLLLITAAMRQIEIVNRNRQGVNDWTETIATDMNQIGMDLVEEEIAEVNQMEG
jgi:hypothetical protein